LSDTYEVYTTFNVTDLIPLLGGIDEEAG